MQITTQFIPRAISRGFDHGLPSIKQRLSVISTRNLDIAEMFHRLDAGPSSLSHHRQRHMRGNGYVRGPCALDQSSKHLGAHQLIDLDKVDTGGHQVSYLLSSRLSSCVRSADLGSTIAVVDHQSTVQQRTTEKDIGSGRAKRSPTGEFRLDVG